VARRALEQEGQGTVEWIALVLLLSTAMVAILSLSGARSSAAGLVRGIATRLVCAADLSTSCSVSGPLVAAYGPELAERVQENAPEIDYEAGMSELPVDFRSCRAVRCSLGAGEGPVSVSEAGQPAAAFVHVIDCRTPEARRRSGSRRYDCGGSRAGNLYLQYWLYYGDSATSPWSELPGRPGYHRDDWEAYQVRIGAGGVDARASSHHGYAYRGGPLNWPSDTGILPKAAWGRATGRLYVSDGSHAGHVYEPPRLAPLRGIRTVARTGAVLVSAAGERGGALARRARTRARRLRVRFVTRRRPTRWTPAGRLRLMPIEALAPSARGTRFAIDPPWRKPVYWDPEDRGA
jgi:hypothetical protein